MKGFKSGKGAFTRAGARAPVGAPSRPPSRAASLVGSGHGEPVVPLEHGASAGWADWHQQQLDLYNQLMGTAINPNAGSVAVSAPPGMHPEEYDIGKSAASAISSIKSVISSIKPEVPTTPAEGEVVVEDVVVEDEENERGITAYPKVSSHIGEPHECLDSFTPPHQFLRGGSVE